MCRYVHKYSTLLNSQLSSEATDIKVEVKNIVCSKFDPSVVNKIKLRLILWQGI